MIRKLALALTTALGCTYATGASAAELAITSVSNTEAASESAVADGATTEAAVEASDPYAYGVAGVAASSQAASTSSSGDGWQFAITPYLWASGFKAKIETPQGENIKVDESFTDILDALKFAMMGAFEAKHGRFVSVHDLMYLSLGSSARGEIPVPIIGPIPVKASVKEKLFVTSHLFGYRVVDNGPMFVDLLAGGRITTVKVDLKLNVSDILTLRRDNKNTEFGPMIASRARFPLSDKWGVGIYGDLGGFGVGADLSWQLLGTVQYDISQRWRLSAGWRHFYAKQKKDDFDGHLKLDGPILGVTYRF